MDDRPDGFLLEASCYLGAPPAQVFDCLTEPGALRSWWGPAGFTTPEIELDLRVGGGYRFGMQPPDGPLFHLSGEFLEVREPHLLRYTFRWEEPDPDDRETVVTLTLQPAGSSGTLLTMSQGAFATEARLELHRAGWTESLARLSDHLEGRA